NSTTPSTSSRPKRRLSSLTCCSASALGNDAGLPLDTASLVTKPTMAIPEHYTYSRRDYKPIPWIPQLLSLKSRVEEATPGAAYANLRLPKTGYNAVLCNLYRNGDDSVGLHADAEPEMGPVIASLSLGAGRVFRLKRKDGSVAFSERLPHGSLLIMAGKTQDYFKHEVPKDPDVTQPRINLTFRHIAHK